MKEYEIYLPSENNDGQPIDTGIVDRLKETLAEAFGGYTHQASRSEGAWSVGGVTFRDEVTILRVLDRGDTDFDWRALQTRMEKELQQEAVLIVIREVRALE